MGWIKTWWQFMPKTAFCGSAFSYGIIISLSQHPARTDFTFHRTLCFNDASCLIPEMQFYLHDADNGSCDQHKGSRAGAPAGRAAERGNRRPTSLRGAGNCPLSSRQSTMIFEEAIPGLLVGAGCSARRGRVSRPSSCSLEWGWWGARAGGWRGAGPHRMDGGHACCLLLFCPERCKRQPYPTEFYKKLLLKKVTDGRK